jgi:hypothetical protein
MSKYEINRYIGINHFSLKKINKFFINNFFLYIRIYYLFKKN